MQLRIFTVVTALLAGVQATQLFPPWVHIASQGTDEDVKSLLTHVQSLVDIVKDVLPSVANLGNVTQMVPGIDVAILEMASLVGYIKNDVFDLSGLGVTVPTDLYGQLQEIIGPVIDQTGGPAPIVGWGNGENFGKRQTAPTVPFPTDPVPTVPAPAPVANLSASLCSLLKSIELDILARLIKNLGLCT